MHHITLATACIGQLETIQGLFGSLISQTRLPDQIILLVYPQIGRKQFEQFVFAVKKSYPSLRSRLSIVSSHNSNHEPGKFHGYDRQFLVQEAGKQSNTLSSVANDSSSRVELVERGISGSSNQGDDTQSQTNDRKIGREGNKLIPLGTHGVGDEVIPILLMIDIDNEFDAGFVTGLEQEYKRLTQQHGSDLVLAPTVMRRCTDRIQSQGISDYSFLVPKYRYASFDASQSPQQVMMIGGNCLFGPIHVFQQVGFDEQFAYSYEDIDFTYRLTQSGIPLYVTATTVTHHMESERSHLDHKLIGSPTSAYYRMRNHLIFVSKNASGIQKLQARCFGVWGLYGWFLFHILIYGGWQRWELMKSLSRGLWNGMTFATDGRR